MDDIWSKLVTDCGTRLRAAAYAWKKQVMYTGLAKATPNGMKRQKLQRWDQNDGMGFSLYIQSFQARVSFVCI